jgi:chemotaxis protein methyltransferase CheR
MLPLQPVVFAILTALIESRGGLHYELVDLDLLAGRMSPRARDLGFESLLDYYYFLRYDPKGVAELDALIETLVNHETFFFRESEQLRLLVDTFLVPMVETGNRPRVWCSASATGEEPYTLAMLLGERKLLGRVELIASDLSNGALAHAKNGVYSGRSLRAVSGTAAEKYLETEGTKVRVPESLKGAIEWKRVNLIEPAQVAALGRFDAILCRNVLIYFANETTTRVVDQLTSALNDGGLLLVGAAESLINIGSSLRCEERSGWFFYRKAER